MSGIKLLRKLEHRAGITRITLFAAALLCADSYGSDTDFFLEQYESYGIEQNDFRKMQIVPTQLMDNEQLFRAAAAERDSSMNMSQRLINNRWLLEEPKLSYSASTALRHYLRTHVLESYQQEREKQLHAQMMQGSYLPSKKHYYSQFSDISNYRLRLSDDHVRIRFYYRFD